MASALTDAEIAAMVERLHDVADKINALCAEERPPRVTLGQGFALNAADLMREAADRLLPELRAARTALRLLADRAWWLNHSEPREECALCKACAEARACLPDGETG